MAIRTAFLSFFLLALGCGKPTPPRPDVVIVLVDTLRADFTTPYGYDLDTTPNLTRLTEESIVFEAASAPAPWTLPSVVSLFSGRHVPEHNVVTERKKVSASIPLLAELLAEVGYRTANFHRNPFAGVKSGLDRGFEQCELVRRHVSGADLRPFLDGLGLPADPEAEPPVEEVGPYLLYVHNAEPHDPHHSRHRFRSAFDPVDPGFVETYGDLVARYRSLTRIDYVNKRPLGTTDNADQQREYMRRLEEQLEEVHNLYACSVRDADDRIGTIVEEIRARGRWDNTLFIVVSDHGEEMADHGGWQHDQSVYQELLHVPLVVKLPGGKHAGKRVPDPVSLVDLFPTILEQCRVPAPEDLPGRSLTRYVEGRDLPSGPRVVAVRHNERKYYRPYKEGRGDVNIAVRDGRWKAILNVEIGTTELYDLEADPGERNDLAAEHPDVAGRLSRFAAESYADMVQRSTRAEEGGLEGEDERILDAMRELGYIGDDEEE